MRTAVRNDSAVHNSSPGRKRRNGVRSDKQGWTSTGPEQCQDDSDCRWLNGARCLSHAEKRNRQTGRISCSPGGSTC